MDIIRIKGGIPIYKRIEKLREKMRTSRIQGVIILSPENRYYFSKFRGTSGALLITEKEALLFTDFRYIDQAKEQAPNFEVIQHTQNLYERIALTLQKLDIKKVGIESSTMAVEAYFEMKEHFKELVMENMDQPIADLRMFKDHEELDAIQRGIQITEQAFLQTLPLLKVGMTEKELGLELEFAMRRLGAEGIKANHVIASGERSALPHGQATERVIQVGDLVKMDIGAKVDGYYSDFTRTVVMGEPSEKQKHIHEVVLNAQLAALDAIGPGKICREMDEVARSIIREAGYGENFGHSLGHSIGLAIHEKPVMRSTDSSILQPNMVVSVEPGIYIPGFGGVRIEDLVQITEVGIHNFTTAPKELKIIG